MTEESAPRGESERGLAAHRLVVGAAQGFVLYLLYRAHTDKVWPGTDPYLLAPLSIVAIFVPLIYVQAVGGLRWRTLIPWIAAETVILAGLGWYDVWRFAPASDGAGRLGGDAVRVVLLAASFVGLFIAHALVLANDAERKMVAPYGAYFDSGTKLGVQFAATVAFVLVFWGVLWLGVVLFNLIKLDFLEALVEKEWFAIPATTLAAAAAIHVSDVRARLWTGIRAVALTLLSWLLPLMTLIVAGFVIGLFFTGLGPLWATRSAAGLLLSAAGVLVVLINAAYQDGAGSNRTVVFRYAEWIAAVLLTPLVALATYALWLRIGQYGWSAERVTAAAIAGAAACYALGYGAAAIASAAGGVWMRWVAPVNVATSYVVLMLLIALFSPLADPQRIAVASQVARLERGAVRADKFDYRYLKVEGGRYGYEALQALMRKDFGAATATVHRMADAALKDTVLAASTRPDLADNLMVDPAGAKLPSGFLKQDWDALAKTPESDFIPPCLRYAGLRCDAVMIDLDGDGHPEIVVLDNEGKGGSGSAFRLQPDGVWHVFGRFSFPSCAAGVKEALRSGDMHTVPQVGRNLVVGGVTFGFAPFQTVKQHCD